MVDRRTVTIEDPEITICITSTSAGERPAAELVQKAILALQSFVRALGNPPVQTSSPSTPTLAPNTASWAEREEAAFKAGQAAAKRHEGLFTAPVPLATNLSNRVYLVARDKDQVTHQPAIECSTWAKTLPLVEANPGSFSRWAIHQGFPSKREAAAWQRGFDTTLATFREV